MNHNHQLQGIKIDPELTVCPECGYQQGFHSIFVPDEPQGKLKWLLVCPSCHQRFDAGLSAETKPQD